MGQINKTDKNFKILINKRFTTDADSQSGRQYYQEDGADTLNLHAREVWTNPVPTDPDEATLNNIAKKYTQFTLTPDTLAGSTNTTQQAWFFQSGSDFTPGDTPNAAFQLTDFIGDKYGPNYEIQLFENNGNQIFKTNAINWIFDYKVGVLHIANPNASHQKPYKVTVYRYIGNTLSSSIDSSGLIESVGFPYSGSDNKFNTPAQAVITGSLLLSNSGHITASGNISASRFIGPLEGEATGLSGTPNVIIGNITASGHISASSFISASSLHITNDVYISGNLDLDGTFDHEGFSFVEDNVTIITGSNSFGESASINLHTFTGSVVISSSQDNVFSIVSQSSTTFKITHEGNVTANNIEATTISGELTGQFSSTMATAISNSWGGYITGSGIVSSSNFKIIHSGSLSLTGSSGHLTASGHISSSGDGHFKNLIVPGTISNISTTNITASGNISASGNLVVGGSISGSSYTIQTSSLASFTGNTLTLGDTNKIVTIAASNINANANITASGNISASGILFASASIPTHNDNIFVVVYDTGSGEFHYTGSYTSGNGSGTGTGTGFPYSGSDIVTGSNLNTPSAAVITGSLLVLGGSTFTSASGHITASGNISASGKVFGSNLIGIVSSSGQIGSLALSGSGIISSSNQVLAQLSGSGIVSSSNFRITHSGSLFLEGLDGHLTASGNISASGFISASELHITDGVFMSGSVTASNDVQILGNLDLDGTFFHEGFNFVEDNVINITGSNSFGSTASLNTHTFTGSVIISSSQNLAFKIISQSSTVFSISHDGIATANTFSGVLNGGFSTTTANKISGSWQKNQGILSGSDQLPSGVVSSSNNLFLAADLTASLDSDVGGVSNGDKFGIDTTIEALLRKMLILYLPPTFSSFNISGLTDELEVGDSVNVTGGSFGINNDSNGDSFASVTLELTNNLNSDGTSNNNLANLNISIANGTISFNQLAIRRTSPGRVSFNFDGTDTQGTTTPFNLDKHDTTDFKPPIFFGGSPLAPEGELNATPTITNEELTDVITVLEGLGSDVQTTNTNLKNVGNQICINTTSTSTFFSTNANLQALKLILGSSVANPANYTYIIYPEIYGQLTSINLAGAQPVLDSFINLGTANHTRFGIQTTYRVYKTGGQNAFSTSNFLNISNV